MSKLLESKALAGEGGGESPPISEYQATFNALYAKIHNELIEGDFTLVDATEIGERAMYFLNDYVDMPGRVKRDIVLRLVNKFVDSVPMDETLRAGLKIATGSLIPWLVERIYKAWMHHFDTNADGKITMDEYKKICCGGCLGGPGPAT